MVALAGEERRLGDASHHVAVTLRAAPAAEPAEAAAKRPWIEAAAAAEETAARVVRAPLLVIRERRVGLLDLLEALLRGLVASVAIGVVLARELAVGLLDLLVGGLLV